MRPYSVRYLILNDNYFSFPTREEVFKAGPIYLLLKEVTEVEGFAKLSKQHQSSASCKASRLE